MRANRVTRGVLVLALLTGACGTEEEGGPCDPLAAREEPTALANVIAAGRGGDGTVYVVDRVGDSMERLFVSRDGTLHRQRVSGSGSGTTPDGTRFHSLAVDGDPPLRVKVEIGAGGTTRMGVYRGTMVLRDFVIGEVGETLDVVSEADAKKMPVRNLAGTVFVEYVADLPDGRRIVVVRPEDDWTYEEFRLFLGSKDAMTERKVAGVLRERDGGTTTIRFDLDGQVAVAFFPAAMRTEPPTLKIGGSTLPLTVQPRTTSLEGAAFVCRS